MPVSGGDGLRVFGMAAERRHSASAVVQRHYVLALFEQQSHVSWLLQRKEVSTKIIKCGMETVHGVYLARIVGGLTSQ